MTKPCNGVLYGPVDPADLEKAKAAIEAKGMTPCVGGTKDGKIILWECNSPPPPPPKPKPKPKKGWC